MPGFTEGNATYIDRGRHLEYNGTCLNVRNIRLGLWWHNTACSKEEEVMQACVDQGAGMRRDAQSWMRERASVDEGVGMCGHAQPMTDRGEG